MFIVLKLSFEDGFWQDARGIFEDFLDNT